MLEVSTLPRGQYSASTCRVMPPYQATVGRSHSGRRLFSMANKPKNQENQPQPGDPLFNLKHAQAESELEATTGGLGPTSNEYISTDENDEIDEGPRDKQGLRRGENPPTTGSTAGSHK